MDHTQFKANQTAAGYVADGLDESTEEEFELHLMSCPECVEDVEVWRAIKLDMPRSRAPRPAPATPMPAFGDWRMAASLAGAALLGAAGGWLGKAITATDLDEAQTVVFNLPAVSRGAEECTVVKLAPETRQAILRVPGLSRDAHLLALDADRRELPAGFYAQRIQPDGSYLLRINAKRLVDAVVYLELHRADGTKDPEGCVSGRIL